MVYLCKKNYNFSYSFRIIFSVVSHTKTWQDILEHSRIFQVFFWSSVAMFWQFLVPDSMDSIRFNDFPICHIFDPMFHIIKGQRGHSSLSRSFVLFWTSCNHVAYLLWSVGVAHIIIVMEKLEKLRWFLMPDFWSKTLIH